MAKTLSVTVPFKDDEKWLYDIIASHSSKSAFIKDVLKDSLKKDVKGDLTVKSNIKINTDSFLDF